MVRTVRTVRTVRAARTPRAGSAGRPAVVLAVTALAAVSCGRDTPPVDAGCPESPAVPGVEEAGYGGVLVDAWTLLDAHALRPGSVGCALEPTRVERIALGVDLDPSAVQSSVLAYRDRVGPDERAVAPFVRVRPGLPVAGGGAEALARVLDTAALLVVGLGPVSVADPRLPTVATVAVDRDAFVAVDVARPEAARGALEAVLVRHPAARVLVSGTRLRSELPRLLRTHPNLYAVVDAASLLTPGDAGVSLLDMPSAREFVAAFDDRREGLLDAATSRWSEVVQAAPRQVLWGSGISEPWHLDVEVYARAVAFSRAFFGRMPEPVAAAVGVDNARRLLGGAFPRQDVAVGRRL